MPSESLSNADPRCTKKCTLTKGGGGAKLKVYHKPSNLVSTNGTPLQAQFLSFKRAAPVIKKRKEKTWQYEKKYVKRKTGRSSGKLLSEQNKSTKETLHPEEVSDYETYDLFSL